MTPRMCSHLRARPRIAELAESYDWNQKAKHFRPTACEKCNEFDLLIKQFGDGEMDMGLVKGSKVESRVSAEGVGEKRCRKCREWKPADTVNFYKDSASPDGLVHKCKSCTAKMDRERNRKRLSAKKAAREAELEKRYFEKFQKSGKTVGGAVGAKDFSPLPMERACSRRCGLYARLVELRESKKSPESGFI